jgi:cellulose synthase/poly-beta-1,6-N-acetylglucosamine synthase-like glycosyltransferase
MGWRRATQHSAKSTSDNPFVSVIIPLRNEATTIAHLLEDLSNQTYSYFEVVLVNDHSEDESLTVISRVRERFPQLKERIKILQCTTQSGKKAALTLGIVHAKGEIILTTDADCRVNADWIQTITNQFTENTLMVIGVVSLSASNFFEELQQVEFAGLIATGAATLGWSRPSMANGANLAFRKSAFERVGGYAGNEHIPSGDDEFLLRKIHQHFPNAIVFCANTKAVVETQAAKTWNDFIQQRLRWAGKWHLHSGLFSKTLAVSIFLFQLIFLLVPWLWLLGFLEGRVVLLLLGGKSLAEYLFFHPVVDKLKLPFPWLAFFVLQFIYPYYVVAVGLLANRGKYVWKGRTF